MKVASIPEASSLTSPDEGERWTVTVHDGDAESDGRRGRALALVAAAGGSADASSLGLAHELEVLCRATSRGLGALGAVVSLMTSGNGPDCVVASADARSRGIGELTFTMGEGPCLDAYALGRPVLVHDLASTARRQWPGYAPSALALGVSAVFAVPLHVGAAQLGVLETYNDRPTHMEGDALAMLLTFAGLGTEMLLCGPATAPDEGLEVRLNVALDNRAEIHQAQGMVMIDLGIGLAEALVRMRANAFRRGVPLIEVAQEIIAGSVLPGGTET